MVAVVTSCWGTYGRYLAEWALSVADQIPAPEQVVIAELGGCGVEAVEAARILDHAGVDVQIVTGTYTSMGAARNTAVAATSAEWVMHLDTDDLLLPGMLRRVIPLTSTADVVAAAAEYPNGHVRTFPRVSARWILAGRVGCLSCSPYRRALWERSPYRTVPGRVPYVDALLWVGFAKLRARFVPMTEPGFMYRQHSDSFRRTLTPPQLVAARRLIRHAAR